MPGTIALTYDDGPDPEWTPRLLEALARADARATFFVDARRSLVQHALLEEIAACGHEVAFHCFEHIRHSRRDERELTFELEMGLGLLDVLGIHPRAWRAPWGEETELTRRLAVDHGLRLWGWSFDSRDWRGDSADRMLAALATRGGLRDGEVVLMHDALGPGARRTDCAGTLALTERLLEAAAREDLATATISARGEVPA